MAVQVGAEIGGLGYTLACLLNQTHNYFRGEFWPHSQEHPEWGGLPSTQAQILIMFLNFHVKM